jgi:hypothetical protein
LFNVNFDLEKQTNELTKYTKSNVYHTKNVNDYEFNTFNTFTDNNLIDIPDHNNFDDTYDFNVDNN